MTVYKQEISVATLDLTVEYGVFIDLKPAGGIRAIVGFNQNGEASGVQIFMMMHNKKGHWQEIRLKPLSLLWGLIDRALDSEGVYAAAYRRLRATNKEFDEAVAKPSDAA